MSSANSQSITFPINLSCFLFILVCFHKYSHYRYLEKNGCSFGPKQVCYNAILWILFISTHHKGEKCFYEHWLGSLKVNGEYYSSLSSGRDKITYQKFNLKPFFDILTL